MCRCSESTRSLINEGRSTAELQREPCCSTCADKASRRPAHAASQPQDVPAIVHRVLQHAGRPLDRQICTQFERYFQKDLGHVRIHVDSLAHQSAEAIGALAYSFGHHIVFRAGQYAPWIPAGARVLVHELTHVLQQKPGAPDAHRSPELVLDDPLWEREADHFALQWTHASRDLTAPALALKIPSPYIARLGSNPGCAVGEAQAIHQAVFDANAWVNNSLRKLEASPPSSLVIASLRRNFGNTYGMAVNIPMIAARLRFARNTMNRMPIGCNSTDPVCVAGHCGFSNAGALSATICTVTFGDPDRRMLIRCVLHESFHAAFSRFTVDHYSSGHGTSAADADYPGTGTDPLLNADSYTTLAMDLS